MRNSAVINSFYLPIFGVRMTGYPIISGFLLASLHVISGPDHLISVFPLAVGQPNRGLGIGLIWGTGHVLSIFFLGGVFYLFKSLIPVDLIAHNSEQAVGLMMIAVGFWFILRFFLPKKHKNRVLLNHSLWIVFGLGILHGLAGISHFVLMLPSLTYGNNVDFFGFIIGFVLGTPISMALFIFLINSSVSIFRNEERQLTLIRYLKISGGIMSVLFGFYWLLIN